MSDDKKRVKRLCGKLRSRRYRSAKVSYHTDHSENEIETQLAKSKSLLSSSVCNINDNNSASETICDVDSSSLPFNNKSGDVLFSDNKENNPMNDEHLSETYNSSDDCLSECDTDYVNEYVKNQQSYIFDEKLSTSEKLKIWAKSSHIKQEQLNPLLLILKQCLPELPGSAKTFFKCRYNYNIVQLENKDEFVYFGIAPQLEKTVNPKIHDSNELLLQFHVDGFSPFKSSRKQFWPLLCKVVFDPDVYSPFNVATYFGESKPVDVNFYLENFVNELNALLKNGVIIEEKKFNVKVMCFICDRPARAFVKQIKSHTAFYSCERCTTRGETHNNRRVFPEIGLERTDDSFRNFENPEHHNDVSLLIAIKPKIDMVKDFSLDELHLACLGIQDKLLNHWVTYILNKFQIMQLSMRLHNLSSQVPEEFQRTTRSLGLLNMWKGVEFSFFLKYCGPAVLKDILPEHLFKHFLLLHMAFRILSNKKFITLYINNARDYLQTFFSLAKTEDYYGLEFATLNVHSLVHLCDDVEHFKCDITKLSAFTFENELKKIKLELRSGYKPLQQLCRRQTEEDSIRQKPLIPPLFCILSIKKKKEKTTITKIKYKSFVISLKPPDNCVLLKNKKILEVNQIHKNLETCTIIGKEITHITPAFTYPPNACEAMFINTVLKNADAQVIEVNLSDVESKIVLLKVYDIEGEEGITYAIPLLHTQTG